ncbi:hypothetical protein BOO86_23565 [Mycobacterium sp. CBMA 234]|uniref:hypothetical protein n=1 Tax=Mycolicibacterium sp. CBMA 234 TaxID=1918495 RepID=UPI0012DEE20C|nr:hypothetical protein [Mycolicibacterium sp. CBMA 234]MUL67472.1 hypothetical protein [Mycolicibacterium sp. CBMA 234]
MTYELTARRTLESSPEALISTLTDSTQFAKVAGIAHIDVIRAGEDGPLSRGTIRKVFLPGGLWLVERYVEVTLTRFDYVIVDSSPDFTHEGGSMVFTPTADGKTDGVVVTKYRLNLRYGPTFAERALAPLLRATFSTVLGGLDRVAKQAAGHATDV